MELANEIIDEQPFNGKKCFIPYHAKYLTGVLRDMDTNLTSEEIIQMFENKFNKVFRMYRYQNNERLPTKSVRVIMEADELPDEVTVYGMRCRLTPFVQKVKLCNKCHRFGHYADKCKSEYNKCENCGQQCINKCTRNTTCSSCGGEHKYNDLNCPVRGIEENILRVMNNNKLSYFEAKDWIRENVSKDTFSYIVKQKDFPTLGESNIRKKIKKVTKVEENSSISLDILKNINELKKMRDIGGLKKIQEEPKITENLNEVGVAAKIRNRRMVVEEERSSEEEINSNTRNKKLKLKK